MSPQQAPSSLVVAVVEAVSDREGVAPTDLPPLYDAVDLDVLGQLATPVADEPNRMYSVTFPYAGYDVTVDGGRVEVEG